MTLPLVWEIVSMAVVCLAVLAVWLCATWWRRYLSASAALDHHHHHDDTSDKVDSAAVLIQVSE